MVGNYSLIYFFQNLIFSDLIAILVKSTTITMQYGEFCTSIYAQYINVLQANHMKSTLNMESFDETQ